MRIQLLSENWDTTNVWTNDIKVGEVKEIRLISDDNVHIVYFIKAEEK